MVGPGPRTKAAKTGKMSRVMHEWGQGELHSGSKKGPVVRSQKQAVAIGLSQSGQSKPPGKRKPLKETGGHRVGVSSRHSIDGRPGVGNRLSKTLTRRVEEGGSRAKR